MTFSPAAVSSSRSRVDRGGHARHAAEAFARRVVLGRAGRIEAVDRLDPAVQVVDVQDVQRRFGGTGAAIGQPARIAVDPRIRENILLSLFIGWASD
jgi:hypothetical protein